jgi:competence protein ComEA
MNTSKQNLALIPTAFVLALAALGASGVASAQRAEHAPSVHAAAHTPRAHADASTPAPSSEPTGVVNIQTATAEQLQMLPGIGPSKAEAIVTYRRQHPFQRVEDILRVRGIGRATFRRLRSMLTVSGATTMTERAHAPRARASTDEPDEASESD